MSSNQISLLILAGGLGSRYGGAKQIDGVGPNGEFLMEYGIYDAIQSGFTKVIVLCRDEILYELSVKLKWVSNHCDLVFVTQEPASNHLKDRTKPLGTAHAVLCCKDEIQGPFVVMNADDFYSREAFEKASEFLRNHEQHGMVSYPLGRTLSEYGGVSRGVCKIQDGLLQVIVETNNLTREELSGTELQEPISMNFWLFQASILNHFDSGFNAFVEELQVKHNIEYLIPSVAQAAIEKGNDVHVLSCDSEWFGLTHAADRAQAKNSILRLIENARYPELLDAE